MVAGPFQKRRIGPEIRVSGLGVGFRVWVLFWGFKVS